MDVAYAVAAAVTALMLGMSAWMKVVRHPRTVEVIGDVVGVPLRALPVLATLEIAGAVGLLVGIGVRELGIAAGVALVLYFVVAISSHIRVRDFVADHLFPAVLMLTVSVATLVLRIAA